MLSEKYSSLLEPLSGFPKSKPIKIACLKSLIQKKSIISNLMEQNGFCILEPWSFNSNTFEDISLFFGNIQYHIRANERGVVGEDISKWDTWKKYHGEYIGPTQMAIQPHTDGTFLNGIAIDEGKPYRIGPPDLILLQCKQNAEFGGRHLLVDSQNIFDRLIQEKPKIFENLFRSGYLSYCRDDQIALDVPIYQLISKDRMYVRFRLDFTTYISPSSISAVKILNENYHLDSQFQLSLSLNPGQILVVDNHRILHGRTEISKSHNSKSNRVYRRIWINSERKEILNHSSNLSILPRALRKFEPYTIINLSNKNKIPEINFSKGISLEPYQREIIEKFLAI